MLNLDLFRSLIEINSVFPHERAVAEFLEPELTQRGFHFERQYLTPNRWNIVASRGTGERTVMYYAHMDTVPEYHGWTRPAFKLTEDENRWYGRGVTDMKGVIASFISAIDNVPNPNHRVLFVLGVDEENISAGSHLFVNQTAEQPDLIISLEGDVTTREWPFPVITTWGRRGRAAYSAVVPGRSAHGATLSNGINAISEAARLTLALDEMPMRNHPELPASSMYVRAISADAGSLSIPDQVELMIDRHLVPPETSMSVLQELRTFIDTLYETNYLHSELRDQFQLTLQERSTPYLEPFVTDPSLPICREVESIVESFVGSLPRNYGSSVADENAFAASFTCPVLCLGPLGGRYHGADEWVLKEGMDTITEIYAELLRKL